jgi:hypothetical protein
MEYESEWSLFEAGGDVFLLRTGNPIVFEVDLDHSGQWSWAQVRGCLNQWSHGQRDDTESLLPIKRLYRYPELLERLSKSTALVSWDNGDGAGEVGCVNSDDLPQAARAFLQRLDAPTYQALEARLRLKDQGVCFDGAWKPPTIEQVLTLLRQAGAYPPAQGADPWHFQRRVTAHGGNLISLYEIFRPSWGFVLRGLTQHEVVSELGPLVSCLKRECIEGGRTGD